MATGSTAELCFMEISDRRRYLEKMKDIGDPYVYSTHDLSKENLQPV